MDLTGTMQVPLAVLLLRVVLAAVDQEVLGLGPVAVALVQPPSLVREGAGVVQAVVADKGSAGTDSAGTDSAADKGSAADTDSAAVEVVPPPL
jgi:hypothetical protein